MSERDAVQNPMLRYADEIGWESISASQALQMRGGDTNLYFAHLLETQLLKLNQGILDKARCKEILRQLDLLNATLEGNREALAWLRGERSIFVPSQDRERNVTLIDFDTPDSNLFHVTDEWRQRNAAHRNRADVVFLINGIPVASGGDQNRSQAGRVGETGVEQIRRYHRETPEMFTTAQLFGVTQLLDFFYGVTWNTSRKNLFNWKADDPASYEDKVKTFFDPARFLKTLRESIIFLSRDDELTKVVLRQHQTRAVEGVVERVYDPIKRRWAYLAHARQRQDADHDNHRCPIVAPRRRNGKTHRVDAGGPQ